MRGNEANEFAYSRLLKMTINRISGAPADKPLSGVVIEAIIASRLPLRLLHPVRKYLKGKEMSFACLVCHSVESPSHSFRSYSVSSSDNEGRCSVIASCLSRTSLIQAARSNTFPASSSSKVTPQPNFQESDLMITEGASPRLVRSRAVRRDIVRDWNFNETESEL
nr:unnamed protein product [Brassica oleracea]